MRRVLAAVLIGCLMIGGAAPAAHAGGAAVSAALGLASFAVFNQLFGPLFYPRVVYGAAPYYGFEPPVVTRSVIYYQAPPPVYYTSVPPTYAYAPAPAYAYAPPPPAAVAPPPPAVAPPPASVTPPPAASPTGGVIYYPHGRYELRGDGVTQPYSWVWIPNPPPPPAPPQEPPAAPPA
jgi:hypothetical protein